jgi:DNA (cytosine-5)-methyltransferase 1
MIFFAIFARKYDKMEELKFIDLFCGIGGFRQAMDEACFENDLISNCVFSSDIDDACRCSYEDNFGEYPAGDITKIDEKDIPDHDILFAGFPCQPFSIIGQRKGFEDIRGTLFFDIARILKEKQPAQNHFLRTDEKDFFD